MTERGELLQRATELVPVLRQRAAHTEELRRIPQETIDDLRSSELLRATQPVRFGGLGHDADLVFSVAVELGRGCGSTSWCYAVWANHNCIMGMFPEPAQEEYWAESKDVLMSTGFNPAGAQLTTVDGGYQLSGRWDFSSGCDDAGWVVVGATGPEGPLLLLVPKSVYTIEDTWFVSGLRGTGSKDIIIDSAFVPKHRSLAMRDMGSAQTPGRQIHGTVNYRIPFWSFFPFTLASTTLGMAQGALDAFEMSMGDGVSPAGGGTKAEAPYIQMQLSEAAAEVWAARRILQYDSQEIMDRAKEEGIPSLDDRVRYRRDQAYVSRLCVRAVDRLFEVSGGHALFDSSALQPYHRDIHAASHHVALHWAPVAEQYGRVRLGLEPTSPWV
jgi:alkylation response protein AidB-like acyl-CoA dehydrogenase